MTITNQHDRQGSASGSRAGSQEVRRREYTKRDGASGLNEDERKVRQKLQNRRAAEKSRGRKRDDM
jgi:hypothetical protein